MRLSRHAQTPQWCLSAQRSTTCCRADRQLADKVEWWPCFVKWYTKFIWNIASKQKATSSFRPSMFGKCWVPCYFCWTCTQWKMHEKRKLYSSLFLFPFNSDKFQVCTCSTFILFKASFQIIIQWSSSNSDQPQPLPKANWFKLWPPKMTFLLLPNVEKLLLVQNSDLYAVTVKKHLCAMFLNINGEVKLSILNRLDGFFPNHAGRYAYQLLLHWHV